MRAYSRDDTRSVMRERERDASYIVMNLYPCLLYAKGDKYLDFFLFLQDVKIAQGFGIFIFHFFIFHFSFFKGISGVNSGIIIISDVREEVFFSLFLFGRTTTTLPP